MTSSFNAYMHARESIRTAIDVCMAEYNAYKAVSNKWLQIPESELKTKDTPYPSPALPPLSPADADDAASYCLGVAALLRSICIPETPIPDCSMSLPSQKYVRENKRPPAQWCAPMSAVVPHTELRAPYLTHMGSSHGDEHRYPPPKSGVMFDAAQASELGLRYVPTGSLNTNFTPSPLVDEYMNRGIRPGRGGTKVEPEERENVINYLQPSLIYPEEPRLPPGITHGMIFEAAPRVPPQRTPEQRQALNDSTDAWARDNGYLQKRNTDSPPSDSDPHFR